MASTEIEVLASIDKALSELDDVEARNRVLAWACRKYASINLAIAGSTTGKSEAPLKRVRSSKKKTTSSSTVPKGPPKSQLILLKDFNLKSKSGKGLEAFVEEKKPESLYEKCATLAHFLKHELDVSAITASHIYTCFKYLRWRLPADLQNTLSYTSSQYGWLDTSDRANIKLTTMGENLVEHDLPKASLKKR